MKIQNKSQTIAFGILLLVASSNTFAGRDGERRGPPPEALEACASLGLDQVCSFTSPRGEVTGTCIIPKSDDSVLACKPEHGGGDHQHERKQRD